MKAHRVVPAALWIAAVLACTGAEDGGRPAEDTALQDTTVRDTTVRDTATPDTVAESPPPVPEEAPASAFPFPLPHKVDDACDSCLDPIVVCESVPARIHDRPDAAVVARFEPGDSLALLGATAYVEAPEIIVFRDTLSIAEAEDWPSRWEPIVFRPGDTVYVLTYGSEGSEGRWWYRGRMWETENVWMLPDNLEWVSRDRDHVAESLGTRATQGWLKLGAPDGREGWILWDRGTVTFGTYFDPGIPPCGWNPE